VINTMARKQQSEDILCNLIHQAIDDVRFHIGAAFSMVELGYVEDAIRRLERALNAYEEANLEFCRIRGSLKVRRRQKFQAELDDVSRKFWIVTRDISNVARNSILLYNQMRRFRLSFLVYGGVCEGQAKAVGG